LASWVREDIGPWDGDGRWVLGFMGARGHGSLGWDRRWVLTLLQPFPVLVPLLCHLLLLRQQLIHVGFDLRGWRRWVGTPQVLWVPTPTLRLSTLGGTSSAAGLLLRMRVLPSSRQAAMLLARASISLLRPWWSFISSSTEETSLRVGTGAERTGASHQDGTGEGSLASWVGKDMGPWDGTDGSSRWARTSLVSWMGEDTGPWDG